MVRRRERPRTHYTYVERGYHSNRVHQPVLPQPSGAGGGIIGGGDTPSTKTLWKIQGVDGYSFGEFRNKNVYLEGPDEENVFVADADGKILKTQYLYPAAIEQLKEAFSVFFGEIETVQILVVTGLAIGDDVPNWENYETLQ